MITRTKARERPSLFSRPPDQQQQLSNNCEETSSQTSPYSLSNEDMNQLTEEFDHHHPPNNDGGGELTTSGRTYEELVNSQQKQQQNNNRDSMMSEETEESEEYEKGGGYRGRQSVGFMLGRNSLSNWSTIGGGGGGGEDDDNDIPSSVQLEQMNTGRKSNVSRHSLGRRSSLGGQSLNLDTPNVMSHVNVSSRVNSRATSQQRSLAGHQARLASRPSHNQSAATGGGGGRRSQHSLNMSHISSSSSSGLLNESEDTGGMLGDSWSPIRTSLENSFVKSVANDNNNNNIGVKRSGSLSPIRGRSSNSSLSPKKGDGGGTRSPANKSKSPMRSPVRSPLGDISPNRSPTRDGGRGQSPKKKGASPKRGGNNSPNRRSTATATTTLPTQKKALSPNGTYSLKEAEGKRLSLPVTTTGSGGSSSNMSLSSGGSHTTSSSKTLLTQSASKTMKMALPSLGSSRKGFQQHHHQKQTTSTVEIASKKAPLPKTVPPSHSQESEMTTMLSPEKTSTKENVRSPAPTPNSQRRVIKRFRASVPTANYLMPEDMLDDSLEKNPSRKLAAADVPAAGKGVHRGGDQAARKSTSKAVAKPMEMEEAVTQESSSSYENAFEFPSSESIPLPRTKTLSFFHDQAISVGSPSHQYQLNRAGTNLLSLQEVILPSIAYETNAVLKEKQAKAQRYAQDGRPDSQGKEVIKAIETCRKVVTKCTGEAMKVAGEAWRTREKEREQLRVQRLANEEEKRKLDELNAKKERKEARARSRHERYERQKRDKQRNHPRNKEMWQEVAKLMVDIQRLEKEERMWKETLAEVNNMEDNYQPPEVMDLESITEGGKDSGDALVSAVKDATLESTTHTLVEDVTMATERINWMLKSVSLAMEESDKLRKDAYDRYQYDGHKFYGYPKVDDSRGLFMALSMESPLRRD